MSGERKFVMTKLAAGDYLLPSNDGQTIWRIRRYEDGPSLGLDIPNDRYFWGVWRWTGLVGSGEIVDPDDRSVWDLHDSTFETRAAAVEAALSSAAETESEGRNDG